MTHAEFARKCGGSDEEIAKAAELDKKDVNGNSELWFVISFVAKNAGYLLMYKLIYLLNNSKIF